MKLFRHRNINTALFHTYVESKFRLIGVKNRILITRKWIGRKWGDADH